MHTTTAGDALEALGTALADAAAVPLSCLCPAEVGEWLCELQGLRARMDALACSGAAEADHAAVQTLEGQRTVAAFVAANTSADPKVVGADRNLGRWLDAFPCFAEAFTDGVLTRRHVQVLRGVDNTRTRALLVKAQEYLVEAARNCGWAEFEKVLRYWVLTFDPDGDEPTGQVESRSMTVSKRSDGMVKGRFLLDPLNGQAALTAIEHEVQRLFRHDSETGVERTHAQRYADALVNLLTRGAGRAERAAAAPLAHIVMSQTVADDAIARLADDDGRSTGADPHQLPLDPDDIDGRCEFVDGTPLHPHLALVALAQAEIRRLVFGPDSEIADLGRRPRCFPTHLKHALLVKARGRCQHPAGCDAAYAWLQADHITAHTNDGPTALHNGQILCDPHNKHKRDRDDGPAP